MQQKLKIGLLIDGYTIPAWAYRMLELIQNRNYAEIGLVVLRINQPPVEESYFKKVWKLRNHLLYFLVAEKDQKRNNIEFNAFDPKNLQDLVNCKEIKVSPIETKYSDRIKDEDIETIKNENIDVFIRLGFKILRGQILSCAKYGIWSYHHGDNAINRGGPAAVWEVLQRWNVTGAVLQIISEDLDGGLKLAETHSSTDLFSFIRNKNSLYWKTLALVPRKLEELHRLGGIRFMEKHASLNMLPQFYYNPLFKMPKNRDVAEYLFWLIKTKIREKLTHKFYFEQWALLFQIGSNRLTPSSFFRFQKICPPKDRFWADPFPMFKDGKYYIFIEELIFAENKGTICVIQMDEKGNYEKPVKVLERPYHLSYPFLFEEDGELYMLPETAGNKSVEIYRCKQFPNSWDLHQTLLSNVYAVDPTLLKYADKYWLFCNIKEQEGASAQDELFLFYADSLDSQNWTPHPLNPIVSDVRNARPAGSIIERNGRLFRPAQNSAIRYGHSIQINEIITLTESEYKEIPSQAILPNWHLSVLAVHTINQLQNLAVADALFRRKK